MNKDKDNNKSKLNKTKEDENQKTETPKKKVGKKEFLSDDEQTEAKQNTENKQGAKFDVNTGFFSDEEVEKKRQKMNRMSKRRFGHVIRFDKYKTSNLIKIICITLGIIIIPLEIFLQNVLQSVEGDLILTIQKAFGNSEGLRAFMWIPITFVRPEITCLFMFFFYLATDSLIAFKSALLTCFGLYIITFLKLLYKDGRPFWLNSDIIGYQCMFDFAGPGYHLYTIAFFWSYCIVMYCMKYAEKVNTLLVNLLFFILFLISCLITIAGLYTGTIFIYQNVIGLLYGLIYLVLCMNFDTEIHKMCEKTGFIVQSSRKYKFYLFFLCIGLFVVTLVYYNSELDYWTMPQSWVVNASEPDHECKEQLLETSNNRLGLDQTFFYTSILFYITGMGFGTSYSLVHVDCLDWVHTSMTKRIIRGLLGCAIALGVHTAFQYIPCNDNPTRFFFLFALPAMILSFFIYGIFPIICMKIGLVKDSTTIKSEKTTHKKVENESEKKLLDDEVQEEEESMEKTENGDKKA